MKNKTVVLGISGGIAAYKAADLASKLTQAGATVEVIMTDSAQKFITPLTLRNLTGRPVVTDMWNPASELNVEHIALADAANVIVIAPATANIIAKLACGLADNMLSATVLASQAPVIIAPSMHDNMYRNTVTQENLAKLKARGFTIIEPESGRLASGGTGKGRLPDTLHIMGIIKQVMGRDGDLAGKRIVVTAGGTQEAIDPVRVISNRSSGKMGYAIAMAARDRGARVTLVTAPTAIIDPSGMKVVHIVTAVEMKKAVIEYIDEADVLIMAAAVADYRPKTMAMTKIKKESRESLKLELVRNPDIVSEVSGNFIKVGFAAEVENLVEHAQSKLQRKSLDFIVANDVSEPSHVFGSDTNKVTIISRDGKLEDLPVMPKREVADKILDRVVLALERKTRR